MSKKEDTIRVAVYRPDVELPQFIEVENELKPLQQVVGGFIEQVTISPDGLVLICNEEGKLDGLPPNRRFAYGTGIDQLVGTFFVCRARGEEFASIHPDDEFRLRRWRCSAVWQTATGAAEDRAL